MENHEYVCPHRDLGVVFHFYFAISISGSLSELVSWLVITAPLTDYCEVKMFHPSFGLLRLGQRIVATLTARHQQTVNGRIISVSHSAPLLSSRCVARSTCAWRGEGDLSLNVDSEQYSAAVATMDSLHRTPGATRA